MALVNNQKAKDLARRWGLNVRHALYRETGNWYHRLTKFPGALLDADGYVIFESEQAFEACAQLQINKQVGAPKGIKAIPNYVYMSDEADRPDGLTSQSELHAQLPGDGQGWGDSAVARRAIETYAMRLAVRHYSARWPEVVDVSATRPFDLLCRDGDRELKVEVKGTTSQGHSVLLTRNEVMHAQTNIGRVALFVVSEIRSIGSETCNGGIIQIHEPWDIRHCKLDPIAYECRLDAERAEENILDRQLKRVPDVPPSQGDELPEGWANNPTQPAPVPVKSRGARPVQKKRPRRRA